MTNTNRSLYVRILTALVSALVVTAAGGTAAADTISLAWDPTSDLNVAGFMLHVGTQSGSYTQHLDVGLSTQYGWSGAVAGQRYCFALSAYNASHSEGPKSNEVCGYSNAYPTLVNPGTRSSTVGQATTLQLQGSDPDGTPVNYAVTGIPPGLSLSWQTGFISGTPTTAGTYTVTATVSDGLLTSSQTFTWNITTGTGGTAPSSGGLRGDYYSGMGFNTLVTTQTDASIDFTWTGSPTANVPADSFSVRWTGEIIAPVTGTYTFSTVSDDGVRLWVGDQLLIDNWTDHSMVTNTSAGVALQGGQRYAVKLEYYEHLGGAVIQLKWTYPGQSTQVIPQSALSPSTTASSSNAPGLRGDYYSGMNFDTLVTTRTDSAVNFSWTGSPAANMPSDNFSVRWTADMVAPVTGTYTFSTVSDDGVRLWVGNQLLIDNWSDHSSTTNTSVGVSLQGGQHYALKLEYYEHLGGAVIGLMWAYPGQSTQVIPPSALSTSGSTTAPPSNVPGLRGDYYSGASFNTLVTTRTDSSVNFTWTGSPDPNVPADGFSVRWTGELWAPVTNTYTFSTVSDDGVRVWLGNQLLIDNWSDHSSTTNTSVGVSLQAGQRYALKVEYYERSGGAVIQLKWSIPGETMQIVPEWALNTP